MIEIRPDMYFVGIWQAETRNGNFMAAMWRNDAEDCWEAKYRFREHRDDKIFDSNDTRTWYGLKSRGLTWTEKENMKDAIAQLLTVGEAMGVMRDVQFHECEGSGEKMLDILADPATPNFFLRAEPKEEAIKKYKLDPDKLRGKKGP